jgi:hypothetical protein
MDMSEQIQPERLRELRDKALRYIHVHGAGQIKGEVDLNDLKDHLGATHNEYHALSLLFINHRLAKTNGSNSRIGLTETGRKEVENIDRKPLRGMIVIHANYSTVQVAGGNSTQTANLAIDQSAVTKVLNQIEQELPRLPLDEDKRAEALGILATLRKVIVEDLPAAGARALVAVLASILGDAGSTLGHALMAIFGLSLGAS